MISVFIVGAGMNDEHLVIIDSIKDALVSNRAKFEKGSYSGILTERYVSDDKERIVEFEMTWDKNHTYVKYKYIKDQIGRDMRGVSRAEYDEILRNRKSFSNPHYILVDDDGVITYNGELNFININRPGSLHGIHAEIPANIWFAADPEYGKNRMMYELIGPNPLFHDSKFEYSIDADRRFIQTRTGPEASVKIVVDLNLDCNVVLLEGRSHPSNKEAYRKRSFSRKTTYQWKRNPRNLCYLQEYDYSMSGLGNPDRPGYEKKLTVKAIDVDSPLDREKFKRQNIYKFIRPNAVENNRITGTRRLLDPSNAIDSDKLDDLVPVIQSKGFFIKRR